MIHGTELVAVHAHVLPVVTCTLLNADADVKDTLVVDTTTLQTGAAWATEKERPPMLNVAVRGTLPVFAAIE